MTKFDEETRQKLIDAVGLGGSFKIACDYAGLDFSNFWRWMQRGKKDHEQNQDTEYSKFRKEIKKAAGKAAIGWLQVIENAMSSEWQSAAWKLERRHFKSYSSNIMAREELKKIEKDIKKLQTIKGETNGKEVDTGNAHEKGSSS